MTATSPPPGYRSVEDYFDSQEFEIALRRDDGLAAATHLAAGRPVYYRDPAYAGVIVREWPDGRRDLLLVEDDGDDQVVGQATPADPAWWRRVVERAARRGLK